VAAASVPARTEPRAEPRPEPRKAQRRDEGRRPERGYDDRRGGRSEDDDERFVGFGPDGLPDFLSRKATIV
jgi:hypothetical protein